MNCRNTEKRAKTFWPAAKSIGRPIGLSETWLGPLTASLLTLLAVIFKDGPAVLGDELGYLSAAKALTDEQGIYLGGGTVYHPGVSLLYAIPIGLVSDPKSAYLSALVVNAVLIGANALVIGHILRSFFPEVRCPFWISSAVLTLIPGGIYYGTFALSESAVAFLFSLYLLIHHKVESRYFGPLRKIHFLLLGFYSGALYLVHPRMVVVVPLGFLAVLYSRAFKYSLIYLSAAVTGLLISRATIRVLLEDIYNTSSDGLSGRSFNPLKIDFLPMSLSVLGGITYMILSTCGLVFFGTWCLVRSGRRSGMAMLLCIGVPLSILILTRVVARGSSSVGAQYLIYGRYLEPVSMPLIAFGAAALITSNVRARQAGIAFSLAAAGGFLLQIGFSESFSSQYPISNSPGMVFLSLLSGRDLLPVAMGLYALLFLVVSLASLKSDRFRMGFTLFLVLALGISSAFALRHSFELDEMADRHREFVETITARSPEQAIFAVDRNPTGQIRPHIFGVQWALSYLTSLTYSSKPPPAASVIVHSGPVLPQGFELLAVDRWTNFIVGSRTSRPTLLLPSEVPRESLRSSIDYSDVKERSGHLVGEFRIENRGEHTWFPRSAAFGDLGAVKFVIRQSRDGEVVRSDRIDLPRTIFPGEVFSLPVDLPLADYSELSIEGLHEGVAWFSDAGELPTPLELNG